MTDEEYIDDLINGNLKSIHGFIEKGEELYFEEQKDAAIVVNHIRSTGVKAILKKDGNFYVISPVITAK